MSLLYMDDFAWIGLSDSSGSITSLGWIFGSSQTTVLPLAGGGSKNWLTSASGQNCLKYQKGLPDFNTVLVGVRYAADRTITTIDLDLAGSNTDTAPTFLENVCCSGYVTATGTMWILDAHANVVASSAPGIVPAGVEVYLELSSKLITGNPITQDITFTTTVNGVATTLTASGVTTYKNATDYPTWRLNALSLGGGGGPVGAMQYFTDMYWLDDTAGAPWNAPLGPVSINSFLPTTNGAVQFTPHGLGANWQNVSQVPLNIATDYNSNALVNCTDTFPLGSNPNDWIVDTVSAISVRGTLLSTNPGFDGGSAVTVVITPGGTKFNVSSILTLPVHSPTIIDSGGIISPPGTTDAWTLPALEAYTYGYNSANVNLGVTSAGQQVTLVMGTFTTTPPTPPLPAPLPVLPRSLGVYRGQVGINFYGKTLFGDAFDGTVGQASFDTFDEYGAQMQGLVSSPPIHSNRRRVFISRFELDIESGVGLAEGQGEDPVWMLQWSKDGGRTWSREQKWRSMGRIGEYTKRLRWMKLGQSRQWIFRLTATDPVRRVIIGVYCDRKEGMA